MEILTKLIPARSWLFLCVSGLAHLNFYSIQQSCFPYPKPTGQIKFKNKSESVGQMEQLPKILPSLKYFLLQAKTADDSLKPTKWLKSQKYFYSYVLYIKKCFTFALRF